MNNKLKTIAAVLSVALMGAANTAHSHATSIGFENGGGPGIINVWLGTYSTGHGPSHLEGSMNLVGVNGNTFASTTIGFTLAAGDPNGSATWSSIPGWSPVKPAGLVDGTTNFYGCDNTPGAALTNTCVGSAQSFGQPTHWQGAQFAGLGAGDYQFTYVPIANPTAEWSLLNSNMNGIFTITGTVVGTVPEPGTLGLLGLGLAGIGFVGRRKRLS